MICAWLAARTRWRAPASRVVGAGFGKGAEGERELRPAQRSITRARPRRKLAARPRPPPPPRLPPPPAPLYDEDERTERAPLDARGEALEAREDATREGQDERL